VSDERTLTFSGNEEHFPDNEAFAGRPKTVAPENEGLLENSAYAELRNQGNYETLPCSNEVINNSVLRKSSAANSAGREVAETFPRPESRATRSSRDLNSSLGSRMQVAEVRDSKYVVRKEEEWQVKVNPDGRPEIASPRPSETSSSFERKKATVHELFGGTAEEGDKRHNTAGPKTVKVETEKEVDFQEVSMVRPYHPKDRRPPRHPPEASGQRSNTEVKVQTQGIRDEGSNPQEASATAEAETGQDTLNMETTQEHLPKSGFQTGSQPSEMWGRSKRESLVHSENENQNQDETGPITSNQKNADDAERRKLSHENTETAPEQNEAEDKEPYEWFRPSNSARNKSSNATTSSNTVVENKKQSPEDGGSNHPLSQPNSETTTGSTNSWTSNGATSSSLSGPAEGEGGDDGGGHLDGDQQPPAVEELGPRLSDASSSSSTWRGTDSSSTASPTHSITTIEEVYREEESTMSDSQPNS